MGKLSQHLGELFGSATAVSRGTNISEAEKLRRVLQSTNSYSSMVLRDYLDWARLIAERNNIDLTQITVEELLHGDG